MRAGCEMGWDGMGMWSDQIVGGVKRARGAYYSCSRHTTY